MKTIAVTLFSVVALIAAAILFMDYGERSESHFKTYRDLEQSEWIGRGWVPAFIPDSAYDIYERHRVDQPYVNVRFRFRPGDIAKVKASCNLEATIGPNTSSFRCKHAGGFVIATLSDNGTGEFLSD